MAHIVSNPSTAAYIARMLSNAWAYGAESSYLCPADETHEGIAMCDHEGFAWTRTTDNLACEVYETAMARIDG